MVPYILSVAGLFVYILVAFIPMMIAAEGRADMMPVAFCFILSLPVFTLPILLAAKKTNLRQVMILIILTFVVGYPLAPLGIGLLLLPAGWIAALVVATWQAPSAPPPYQGKKGPPPVPPPIGAGELIEMHDGSFKRSRDLKPGDLLKGPLGIPLRYE